MKKGWGGHTTAAFREGPGVGPDLIVVRRASDGFGAETFINWDEIKKIKETRSGFGMLLVISLRDMTRVITRKTWKSVGRSWSDKLEEEEARLEPLSPE